MHVVQAKRTEKKLVIEIVPWKVARGHFKLPRGGVHKDLRRPARGNARVALKRGLEQ